MSCQNKQLLWLRSKEAFWRISLMAFYCFALTSYGWLDWDGLYIKGGWSLNCFHQKLDSIYTVPIPCGGVFIYRTNSRSYVLSTKWLYNLTILDLEGLPSQTSGWKRQWLTSSWHLYGCSHCWGVFPSSALPHCYVSALYLHAIPNREWMWATKIPWKFPGKSLHCFCAMQLSPFILVVTP